MNFQACQWAQSDQTIASTSCCISSLLLQNLPIIAEPAIATAPSEIKEEALSILMLCCLHIKILIFDMQYMNQNSTIKQKDKWVNLKIFKKKTDENACIYM